MLLLLLTAVLDDVVSSPVVTTPILATIAFDLLIDRTVEIGMEVTSQVSLALQL
jgi:hypothetical protein